MRRVVIDRPGGHERLRLVEETSPKPRLSEVCVEVAAIGVNFADIVVRMGLYESAKSYVGWPITPGFEFAGRVVEVGADVTGVELGAEVIGVSRFGGYSTHISVPPDQVFSKPPALDMAQAATLPVAYFTAWYALVELGAAAPGMSVLIHSAAGGVGLAALQVATARGCRPIAVVGSSHKVEAATAYGAEHVIDKSSLGPKGLAPELERLAPEGFDIALDSNGGPSIRSSFDHLRPTGRLVVYGAASMLPVGAERPSWPRLALQYMRTPRFNPLDLINANKAVLGFNLSYLFDRADLLRRGAAAVFGWLDTGAIRPLPVTRFPLAEVAAAHHALESGATVGKLALIP
jgi:NADPH:quinone reductase-like Zn-dependent oxidoreductase